jgi:zinc transporter ZupT
MTNLLAAATLDGSLSGIVTKLNELMNSFWIYIVLAMAAVVVVWVAYVGIKIAIAHKNEDKINSRDMVKSLIIGIVVMFVIAVGAPLLIEGLSAWVGTAATVPGV